jgi:hypothetical protein
MKLYTHPVIKTLVPLTDVAGKYRVLRSNSVVVLSQMRVTYQQNKVNLRDRQLDHVNRMTNQLLQAVCWNDPLQFLVQIP